MQRFTRLAASAALAVMVGSLLLGATPAAAKPLRAECNGSVDQPVDCAGPAR